MNLRQLKRMIKEEYSNYLYEQDEIGVDVQPDDIDAMDMGDGGDDAEGTLRDIYDMLKDYFEGEEEMPMDEPMDEPMDDVEGEEDEEADLAEWNGKTDKKATKTSSGKYGAAGYKNFSKTSGHRGFGDSKSLNEIKRFKKLANIIK